MTLYDILVANNKTNWRAVVEVIIDHYDIEYIMQDHVNEWGVLITQYNVYEINQITHEYYQGNYGVIFIDALITIYTSKEYNDNTTTARNNFLLKLKYHMTTPKELVLEVNEHDYNETYGYYSETPIRSFSIPAEVVMINFHQKKLELS